MPATAARIRWFAQITKFIPALRYTSTGDEAIGFGEAFVLDTDPRDPALFQLLYQAPQVIEVAITRVAVQKYRDLGNIRHELQHLHHLGPARFIIVAHPILRR